MAHQALLSMGFPRQEYWSGVSFPSPGDLPDSGIEPKSSALLGGFFTPEPSGKASTSIGPLKTEKSPTKVTRQKSHNTNQTQTGHVFPG